VTRYAGICRSAQHSSTTHPGSLTFCGGWQMPPMMHDAALRLAFRVSTRDRGTVLSRRLRIILFFSTSLHDFQNSQTFLNAGMEIGRCQFSPSTYHLKDHDLTRRIFPWVVTVPTSKTFLVKGVGRYRCVTATYSTKVEGTDVQPLPHLTTPLALRSAVSF
jgi:hypothetical protein